MEYPNNLQSLSGIQFENLCQLLLQKMDFSVKTTSISGDGGIDLIAFYDKPILKGKYIVQCKRYSGSVGVPVVRDLYGVVMDERANKGILITTGIFTSSAREFSLDKNLELIDGAELFKLLDNYALLKNESQLSPVNFLQHKSFDKEKYQFYSNMVAQSLCTLQMGRDYIFTFLFGYMDGSNGNTTEDNYEILHSGLAKEFIDVFDWFAGKYYRRGKKEQAVLPYYVRHYRGIAQLYNFDLFEYVQARYDILTSKNVLKIWTNVDGKGGTYTYGGNRYALSEIPDKYYQEVIENLFDSSKVKYLVGYKYHELLNLLSLFSFLKIEAGIEVVNRILYGHAPQFQKWVKNEEFYKLLTEKFKVLIPKITVFETVSRSGNRQFDRVDTDYKTILYIEQYYEIYQKEHYEKIEKEKEKILSLLNTLKA